MNVWLNIPANSKLIKLIDMRESIVSQISDDQFDFLMYELCNNLLAVERAILSEITALASEANLLQGGVK